jgi:hypothetical protein
VEKFFGLAEMGRNPIDYYSMLRNPIMDSHYYCILLLSHDYSMIPTYLIIVGFCPIIIIG